MLGDLAHRLKQLRTGLPQRQSLPPRVTALVRQRDRSSEKLVCAVQFILAATLATLYGLARRPVDVGMAAFAAVPVALATYMSLVAIRAWIVSRRQLPPAGVALSIVADVTLLIGLIWSIHWTYSQPPAFSLKAPTFVYIFVFIAVRALRFDYRYVLAAGLAAALGWLVMLLAAIANSPSGVITRGFSDYILSNHILIGAEFDKIFAILCVTAILALAAWRAEQTLADAVRVEVANKEIGRFLSFGVAEQIANAETEVTAGQAHDRDAAIMFLDIRGFTSLAMRIPAGDLVALLTDFHRRVVPVVRRHGGVIDKFLGDGVMITFGAAARSRRPAAQALCALEELLNVFKTWQADMLAAGFESPLDVNAAVAAGRVVFAALGDGNRLEYTVIGEAVNLSAKLEKHNKSEGTLALAPLATFELAQAQGFVPRCEPVILPSVSVMGVKQKLDLVCWPQSRS